MQRKLGLKNAISRVAFETKEFTCFIVPSQ